MIFNNFNFSVLISQIKYNIYLRNVYGEDEIKKTSFIISIFNYFLLHTSQKTQNIPHVRPFFLFNHYI